MTAAELKCVSVTFHLFLFISVKNSCCNINHSLNGITTKNNWKLTQCYVSSHSSHCKNYSIKLQFWSYFCDFFNISINLHKYFPNKRNFNDFTMTSRWGESVTWICSYLSTACHRIFQLSYFHFCIICSDVSKNVSVSITIK